MLNTALPPQFGAVRLKRLTNQNHNAGMYDVTVAVTGKDRRHFNSLLNPSADKEHANEIRLYTVHSYGSEVNGHYIYGEKSNKVYRLAQELLRKAPIPHRTKCALQQMMKSHKQTSDRYEAYDKSQAANN